MKDLKLRQVSRELSRFSQIGTVIKPAGGWIKTIRESMFMSTHQFAKRLGVAQQRISALERAEQNGVIKIKSLEQAANALNCRLVYFLLPEEPLETILENRAKLVAKKRIEESSHSMDLEAQSISQEEKDRQINQLARDLLEKHHKSLWENE
jgi:predicted DNA-binding mobile mystery protein A